MCVIGEDVVDTDIPTDWEGRFFTNSFLKVIWVICQPLFYALRPNIVRPMKPNMWIGVNWIAQVAFNYAIYHFIGGKGLTYLIIGTLLGIRKTKKHHLALKISFDNIHP